ncbi:MAG: glutathione S-transferase family protein [Waddliaceae bacterium]
MKRFKYLFLSGVSALALLTTVMGTAATETTPHLELWGTRVSPFVRKDMNVLEYKKLPYQHHEILPKALSDAKKQSLPSQFQSPLGKIPVLTAGASQVPDSAVIAAYLEKIDPSNNVYPTDPEDFWKAFWLEKYSDTVMTDVSGKIFYERVVKPIVLEEESNEELVNHLVNEELPKVLTYLDQWLSENSTPYLVGEELTIADFAVIHHLINLDISEVEWKTGQYNTLEKYYQKMLKEKIILKSLPEFFLDKLAQ